MYLYLTLLFCLDVQQRRGKKSGPNDDEADTASKKSAKKGKAKKKKAKDDGDGSDGDDDESKKKPRIKIKVKAKRSKKKATKRKRGADTDDDDETISDAKAESDAESVPKSKRRKKNGGKASAAKKVAVSAKKDDSSSDDDVPLREVAAKSKRRKAAKEADVKAKKPESVFLDLDFWKSSRESLDGSFKAARKNFFQVGPWELPQGIPEEKFTEVAYITLDKMNKYVFVLRACLVFLLYRYLTQSTLSFAGTTGILFSPKKLMMKRHPVTAKSSNFQWILARCGPKLGKGSTVLVQMQRLPFSKTSSLFSTIATSTTMTATK